MKNVEGLVENILRADVLSRDDDFRLYYIACYWNGCDVKNISFKDAMLNARKLGLPSYESITRGRRKVQEKIPTLRGDKYDRRKKMQEEYREKYSKE